MKRVLIITYYWPPSGGAGVQRWLKFAKYLPGYDWEPVILTVDPQDATYPVTDPTLNQEINPSTRVYRTRSKELFSLYKKVSGAGQVPHAGFAGETHRISFKQIIARFIRGNFFLPDPRKGWNRFAAKKAGEILSNEKIDCIVTTGPPHSTHLIGIKLSEKYRIPWVADFRDPWTDIYYYKQFYPGYFANKYNKKKEKEVLEKANMVLTVGPTLQEILGEKITLGRDKVKVITNGYDPDDFKNLEAPDPDYFTLTYVGTIAETYPLEPFFKALKSLLNEFEHMRVRFIGTISSKFLQMIKELPQGQIKIMSYVEHATAIGYMSSSDALLLVIPSHASNKGILTGKLFEYLAVARPVLLIGPEDGDAASILREAKSGSICSGMDEKEIKNILSQLIKAPPTVYPVKSYNREIITRKLAGLFDGIRSQYPA